MKITFKIVITVASVRDESKDLVLNRSVTITIQVTYEYSLHLATHGYLTQCNDSTYSVVAFILNSHMRQVCTWKVKVVGLYLLSKSTYVLSTLV